MESKNNNSKKGPAYIQPDHIRPKSKWTKKTTVWAIVIAVVVLGILAIIGSENGWFKTQDMINGKIILGDYSAIEVDESAVRVSDSDIDSFLNSIISIETTSESVTEGTVEDGDTINLDYTGVLKGEEEPFDGGTASGSTLTLGSGTMIEGFESAIAGHDIGETFDIDVTFPEDYRDQTLAGKDAAFTITVNSKTVTNVPEMSDELVQKYSSERMDQQYDTVDAIKEYYTDYTYNSRLENAIMTSLEEKADVKYYNEANYAALTAYNETALSYYGSQFGVDAATMASMYGYDTVKDYAEATTKESLKQTMILDTIAQEQGITGTDEEFNEVIQRYMENEGFTGTMDEFVAQADDIVLYMIRETEVLQPKVMEYLKGNVVIIESEEEETSEAEGEPESAAAVPAADEPGSVSSEESSEADTAQEPVTEPES